MKFKIPVIVSSLCILAMFSCLSKNDPGKADTASLNLTSKDSLDKNHLPDTLTPGKHAAGNPTAEAPLTGAKIPSPPQHTIKSVAEPKGKPAGSPAAFANTTDFICGMEVMPDYTDTCHLDGKVYAFCSEYCKNKFKENPKKHLEKK